MKNLRDDDEDEKESGEEHEFELAKMRSGPSKRQDIKHQRLRRNEKEMLRLEKTFAKGEEST